MSKGIPFKPPSKKRRESLALAAEEYAKTIAEAAPYLTSRGIDLDAANRWLLGFVANPRPGHEEFTRMLAIPYVTLAGVVDIKFRCVENHDCKEHGHPKYNKESGYSTRLFGVMSFQRSSPFVCVCEGELDALVAAEYAGMPAVAVPGVQAWKPHYPYLFEGYADVIVLRDGDDAGKKLADRVIETCHNARSVAMPTGEDVNSFLVKHGAQALRDKVGVDMSGDD